MSALSESGIDYSILNIDSRRSPQLVRMAWELRSAASVGRMIAIFGRNFFSKNQYLPKNPIPKPVGQPTDSSIGLRHKYSNDLIRGQILVNGHQMAVRSDTKPQAKCRCSSHKACMVIRS